MGTASSTEQQAAAQVNRLLRLQLLRNILLLPRLFQLLFNPASFPESRISYASQANLYDFWGMF